MDFKELKIGYVPYLPDLSQPADRRRFPYFAKRNNISFEIANKNKSYDIILLTAPANLSQWLLYKKNHPETKFIFEMADSLIFSPDIFTALFKGIGRFILRKETSLFVNYKNVIIQWLKIADIVLCSSVEIRNIIKQWNQNVVVSLDYLQSEYKFQKTDFSIKGKMKLVWEGQGAVLRHFLHFKELLKELSPYCELDIITSDKYPLFGKLIHRDVTKILDRLPITTRFHRWDLNSNYQIFLQCDCGVIPINRKNSFIWHKPANKLISFWFTCVPTLVSDTPAYTDMMNNAGENFYCSSIDEWIAKIKYIKNMTAEEREKLAKKNLSYVQNNYSDEALDLIWNQIFETLKLSAF